MNRRISALLATAILFATPFTATAERLTLSFLPPDLPPGDICNVAPEVFEENEIREAEAEESSGSILDDTGRLQFLGRDIHNMKRENAARNFSFIMALITRRAELDPGYAGVAETFERIDTYLAYGRLEALSETGMIQSLTEALEDLSWAETVRLARFYLNGTGVEKDRDFAKGLILDQAYLGNADALKEVLRMQLRGEDVGDWSLDTEETARLAFGGMIGRMNRGLCARAERMAREYIDGDLLTPNADLAFAWRKFAADMGGGEAAWRVVEHHLNATEDVRNEAELRRYLQLAVANLFAVMPEDVETVIQTGATTESEIRRVLAENQARVGTAARSSAVPYLELDLKLPTTSIAEKGEYLEYLQEISELPDVPGTVLTRLAKEVLLRKGRWAGEVEVMRILQRAVDLEDPEAMTMLSGMLLRQRKDPARIEKAESLLVNAVARHGHADAMKALDTLYRCQMPTAPLQHEADYWADTYRAADLEPVVASANDLARLDARIEPETVARIQGLAIRGHSGSAADLLQYMQSDPLVSNVVLRHWARRVSQSDVALEEFVRQEFELALTAGERRNAVELFRRAYLDVGASISLDLAVTLIEHAGRDPGIASEIRRILKNSGERGQGAAIRLLQRLTGQESAQTYSEFAEVIEARGDFVALMVAAPHVPDETFDRYMDRAVAEMSCSTKDVLELAEAHASRNLTEEAAHWLSVSLAIEGGNSLSRLGLSDRQMADFDRGLSISKDMLDGPSDPSDTADARRLAYLAAADPDAPDFDAALAGESLADLFQMGDRDAYIWALERYRLSDPLIRGEVDKWVEILPGLTAAADQGEVIAQYHLGMLLRTLAQGQEDLEDSTAWLERAAEGGHGDAMLEYAFAAAFGIGRMSDRKLALIWLDNADHLYPGRGRELRGMLSAMTGR